MANNVTLPRISFLSLLIQSTRLYKRNFGNYLFLAIISYLPFLIIEAMSSADILVLIDFFHGNFLDLIVFLTLPTLAKEQRIYPFATLQIFTQNFFLYSILLSFIQLGILFFIPSMLPNIGSILIGVILYIFILFPGFFLVITQLTGWLKIKSCLSASILLVRGNFMVTFANFMLITIFVTVPVLFYSVWYLSNHSDLIQYTTQLQLMENPDIMVGKELIELVQKIIGEQSFRWGRFAVHILFQPLKSLFLAFLIIGLADYTSTKLFDNYLGRESNTELQEKPS
jgi:hypothetical protein